MAFNFDKHVKVKKNPEVKNDFCLKKNICFSYKTFYFSLNISLTLIKVFLYHSLRHVRVYLIISIDITQSDKQTSM